MTKKVLIIDDSQDNLTLCAIMLKKEEGIETFTANSGEKGLDLITKGDFNLILLDIHMPGMDGVETLKAIREYEEKSGKEKIKVIALTGSTMSEEIKEIMDAGFDKHLAKPILKQALIDTINQEAS